MFYLFQKKPSPATRTRGVALLLVVFIVTLASALVVNLTYSAYIGGRLNANLEQGLKGEYLVKSALTLARVLIRADTTDEDSPKDAWALFQRGLAIPSEWIGLNEPNVKIELEITPLESKLPIRCLVAGLNSKPDQLSLEVFEKLFQLLGFDNDQSVADSGPYRDKVFTSKEMVANLVDYMDSDKESLNTFGFQGIESDLPDGTFPNREVTREGELAVIPGFTPERVQKLIRFVSLGAKRCSTNINTAPLEVLEAMHPDIQASDAQRIKEFREGPDGPFKQTELRSQVSSLAIPSTAIDQLNAGRLIAKSSQFVVIAKAEFRASVTYLRARIDTELQKGSLPKITSMELY